MVVVLPAPFGPQEAEYLSLLHLKGEVVHRRYVAVSFRQILYLDDHEVSSN